MRRRLPVLIFFGAWLSAAPAAADWLITPLVGYKFAGDTNILDLEEAAGLRKFTFGASFGVLTPGVLGVEVDWSYMFGYFDGEVAEDLVIGSRLMTLMGDVIIAVPMSVTRDGLRPYVVAGAGLIRPAMEFVPLPDGRLPYPPQRRNLVGMNIGGGAIGRLTPGAALRFELRRFRSLSDDPEILTVDTAERVRIAFWRATVGVAFRY